MLWMLDQYRDATNETPADVAIGDQVQAQLVDMLAGYGVDLNDRCSRLAVIATVDYLARISTSLDPQITVVMANDFGAVIDMAIRKAMS